MSKKLKIIRVTTKPEALLILLRGQLKFINNFHDLIGVSSPNEKLTHVMNQEGIRVIPLDMTRKITPIKDMVALIGMIRILRKERPDVVHSHTPKAGIIAMLASLICKIPHRLHTVAGLPLMETSGFKKKILLFIEWLTYRCATKVCPNSNGIKKFILENISISKDKLRVIGFGSSNGVDLEYFDRSQEVNHSSLVFRKKFNLESVFSFIFIGRIVKDKGIEELLKAFLRLNREFGDMRLIILGHEERDLDPISYEAKNTLSSNKNIINLGFKTDVRAFLASSNCLVLPSYREGFPNVILQASSMQVASIASDIIGCNEIIHNKVNGLLFKPKNIESLYLAMKKIYLDKELTRMLAISAKKNVIKKYNKDFIHNEILSFYSNLNNKIDEKI